MSYRNSPRCSFCYMEGHAKNHCPQIKKRAEQGIQWAVEHVKQQKLAVLNRKCSYCSKKGHNKRTCTLRGLDDQTMIKLADIFVSEQKDLAESSGLTVGSLVYYSPQYHNDPEQKKTIAVVTKIYSGQTQKKRVVPNYSWLYKQCNKGECSTPTVSSEDLNAYWRWQKLNISHCEDIIIHFESFTDSGVGYWGDSNKAVHPLSDVLNSIKRDRIKVVQ